MRDLVIITGMCAAAILIGAWLYFYGPTDLLTTPEQPAQSAQSASASNAAPVTTDVSFTVIGHGKSATVTERKNYAVYSADDFAKVWKMTGSTEKIPTIDFTKAYVVAVFAGNKPTGGYVISVKGIKDAGNARNVDVLIEKPGKGCVTTESVTSPYQIVRVPFSEASLGHSDVEVETPCAP